jgi:PAS domain S-box-containing protein
VWRDAAGVTFQAEQGLVGLRAVTNAPFFVISESEFGLGAVGGRLFPDRSLGIQAAAVAARILRGEPPSSVSVPPLGSLPPVYDWRELERWGISESRLPAGSTVAFRPPTIWQQYKGYVAGTLGLVALQTAMIAGLLVQRRRRRRMEEDLAFSEQRLQLITNSVPALIVHVDRDQRYTFANRAYREWFGLGPQQLLGRPMREVLGEGLYRNVRPYVERALAGERVSFTTDAFMEGGEARYLEAIYVPDRGDLGKVRGFYKLMLDVADRVCAQQEARRLLFELAHADRMSMMGELAAAMAHEVNQPLAAILTNAQAA